MLLSSSEIHSDTREELRDLDVALSSLARTEDIASLDALFPGRPSGSGHAIHAGARGHTTAERKLCKKSREHAQPSHPDIVCTGNTAR